MPETSRWYDFAFAMGYDDVWGQTPVEEHARHRRVIQVYTPAPRLEASLADTQVRPGSAMGVVFYRSIRPSFLQYGGCCSVL